MTISPSEILGARLLIVDDQAANISLLERFLGEAGYTQLTSTQLPQAVAAMHLAEPFDLILLDLQMPQMDGFAVMAELQSQCTSGYLPVIALTAQPSHKLRALQAGAKDFISKPFDLLEVKTRIHNLLEVRLLYKRLGQQNALLEKTVAERTAELRESETRYRRLAELACDWFWEQDANGVIVHVAGPVLELLGMSLHAMVGPASGDFGPACGWNEQECAQLRAKIQAREPFLDFPVTRTTAQGQQRRFRISGEPMFDPSCHLLGYRGVGVELLSAH